MTCDFTLFRILKGSVPGIGGINDSDTVSGTVQIGMYLNAFVRQPSGHVTIFHVNGQHAQASKINDHDAIVGIYPVQNVDAGFIRQNGKITTLKDPDGHNGTSAYGINNTGEVVGFFDTVDAVQKGFIYKNGQYKTFSHAGWSFLQPEGVNDQGAIVGSYVDKNSIMHGFLFANAKYTTMNYPGAADTAILGINDSGKIVGWYLPKGSNSSQGFVSVNGKYYSLKVNGQASISVDAVNNKGDIYGDILGKSFIGKNCH